MPKIPPASFSLIRPDPRWWILGPRRDLLLFVLAPLWILPLVWWAKAGFDINSYGAIALALGGVGHHLPGFIRAYTDPRLFRRYRVRFIVAPLFLVAVFAAFTALHLHGLQVLIVLWGAWHGAMQVNGFLRIYDAKAGSVSPVTARLDWAMCLAWFGAGLLHSHSRLIAILLYFYRGGTPALDPALFETFRGAWDVLTIGVTAAFVFNAWRQTRAGNAPSPVKYLLMASTFGFWWFAMVAVDHPILGLLLFEIFHDIQYNALVWTYNRGRVAQGMTASRVERLLFRPGYSRILLYALLVLGYGALGVVSDYASVLAPDVLRSTVGSADFWAGLFTVSAFLHFYFDGFIWRVRETEIRRGLGIGRGDRIMDAPSDPASVPTPAGLVSAHWKWAYFVVPAFLLGAAELRGPVLPEADQFRNIARVVPDDWSLNYFLGFLEKTNQRYEEAAIYYERSIDGNPAHAPAHAELGDIYFNTGRPALALPHYRRAAELDSLDYANRDHLATALLMENRVAEALPHLRAAADHAPRDTGLAYLTGAALMHLQRPAEALPYLYRTLELDPAQPRAWFHLGQAAQLLGDARAAAEYFRRAAALDPTGNP